MKCLCTGAAGAGGVVAGLSATSGVEFTAGASTPAIAAGALVASGLVKASGALAGAGPLDGRIATPGVTKTWVLGRAAPFWPDAATGAGFAAGAATAFAVDIEMRRRAWLGSMPKDVTTTANAVNKTSFFTVPPDRMESATANALPCTQS